MVCAAVAAHGRVFAAPPAAPGGTNVVAEGKDFATWVLRDPWDMNALTDVSIYLNRSGQSHDTKSISVANGVFSAISNSGDTNFSPLFPGYENMIKSANEGALHPINSATYHCLYVAMKVDEVQVDSQAQLLWFKNTDLNNGDWGQSGGFWTTENQWILYAWDLNNTPATPPSNKNWTGSSTWQGLRIDPTQYPNTPYQVDWVRLTDCASVNTTINFNENGSINALWLQPIGTNRNILTKTGVNGGQGSTQLDVQGIQPGTYTVRMGTATSCCIANAYDTLVVNQAPIAEFVSPSFISGAEYAANAGAQWDFADTSDITAHYNNTIHFGNGAVDIVTQPGPPPAGSDSQIFLNTPLDFQSSQYRYLNIRMETDWGFNWPNMPDGMVMRWIWGIPGHSGAPTNRCYVVSQDIPFDIGWRTYTIDLADAYNGSAEETAGDCPNNDPHWNSSGTIKDLRLDPNENITAFRDPISGGAAFHQLIDWIKLTAMDRVDSGQAYLIKIDVNVPPSAVSNATYYYTTSLSDPDQHPANRWSPPRASGPYRLYTPLVTRPGSTGGADTLPQADLSFWWNTNGVPNNTYYVCARLTAGPNTTTFCSPAPIQVY
jgi:hypothetical protein